jgi:dTDP-4-amino-4,6-dideoxygalactose transaminase
VIKFLDLKEQYKSLCPEMNDAITSVLADADFIGGRRVATFEAEFADYVGAKYCLGVGNGTDALEIAIEALQLPAGSEIIVPANTFIATAEAVTRTGHRVVFCDCDSVDYTMNVASLEACICDRTSAIIPVHLYGNPADMEAILRLASEHGLKVIEDCAQAHGARLKGRHVGTFGDVGAFSFYPGKVLGAYGDGGAVVTSDEAVAVRARMIANHGRIEKYNHEFEGRNSRLDALQAAVLSVKLPHLDSWVARRGHVADRYMMGLKDCAQVTLPGVRPDAVSAFHLFVIRTKQRDALKDHLTRCGIETGIHYPIPLPRLKAYDYLGTWSPDMQANQFGEYLLSLPMGEHLRDEDVDYVCRSILEFFSDTGN